MLTVVSEPLPRRANGGLSVWGHHCTTLDCEPLVEAEPLSPVDREAPDASAQSPFQCRVAGIELPGAQGLAQVNTPCLRSSVSETCVTLIGDGFGCEVLPECAKHGSSRDASSDGFCKPGPQTLVYGYCAGCHLRAHGQRGHSLRLAARFGAQHCCHREAVVLGTFASAPPG